MQAKTADQLAEMRQLGQIRTAEAKTWAENNLEKSFADEAHWRAMAAKYGIRMPPRYIPGVSLKYFKRALRRLNIEPATWCQVSGTKSLGEIAAMNPRWPAYALIGLALEWREENP